MLILLLVSISEYCIDRYYYCFLPWKYLFHKGTKIIIPVAAIKNRFFRFIPPPYLIKDEHNQTHSIARNIKPIILPVPIDCKNQISSLTEGVSTGGFFSSLFSLMIKTHKAPIPIAMPASNIIIYSGANSPGRLIKERIQPPAKAATI